MSPHAGQRIAHPPGGRHLVAGGVPPRAALAAATHPDGHQAVQHEGGTGRNEVAVIEVPHRKVVQAQGVEGVAGWQPILLQRARRGAGALQARTPTRRAARMKNAALPTWRRTSMRRGMCSMVSSHGQRSGAAQAAPLTQALAPLRSHLPTHPTHAPLHSAPPPRLAPPAGAGAACRRTRPAGAASRPGP